MEIDSNDKLLVALDYIFTPIVPVIIMLMEDKKNRPFIKAHNAQSLVIGVIQFVLMFLGVFLCGIPNLIVFIAQLYWAYKGYQGELVNIPIITDFVKNQGWA